MAKDRSKTESSLRQRPIQKLLADYYAICLELYKDYYNDYAAMFSQSLELQSRNY